MVGELGRLIRSPLVDTDWNWFERISALDLLSIGRNPLMSEIPVVSLLSDFV